MKRLIYKSFTCYIFLGIILNFSSLYSQKVGSTSMQFLKVMPSARATALGEAYTVWATGAEAIFWNPAGLAESKSIEFSTTYISWLFDSQQGAFSYAHPLGEIGVLGLQLQYVDFGEFEETTLERPIFNDPQRAGLTGRKFSPFSYLLGISYSRFMTDKFSIGISMKYAHESLFNGKTVNAYVSEGVIEKINTWADGLLFDFGIRYDTGFRSLYIGSAVQNFGADVKYAKEYNPVPLLFRFGAGANIIGSNGLFISGENDNRMSFAADIFHPNDYEQQVHVGFEYEYGNMFALRSGYKFNYDYDGLTLGAGLKHNMEGYKLTLDYSYGDMGTYLENVQRFSFGVILP